MVSKLKENGSMKHDDRPLITIVGVLGKQGRSAAQSLIESGRYRVRGITRRINSPEALKLAEQGVELIRLPLDLGYKKEFAKAFRGSDGVFLMTPNIAPPATHEFELGKQLADAAVVQFADCTPVFFLRTVAALPAGCFLLRS